MKNNNVQPNEVNSTIKHILDVKEEAGSFMDLAARRRGGVMFGKDPLGQATDNFLLESTDHPIRATNDSLDSKSKKKFPQHPKASKENNNPSRHLEQNNDDDDEDEDPQHND